MGSNEKRDVIEVWRPHDVAQIELRRGFGIARPVPRHWHDEYQLCLIQSGPSELKYRGNNFLTPPASLFLIYPGEVHSNRAHDSVGCSYRTLFVEVELMRRAAAELWQKESGLPFFPTAVIFDRDIIKRYLEVHFALERPSSGLERQSLLLDLLAELITRFAENRPTPRGFGSEHQALSRAFEYLVAHCVENISLKSLAGIANLSPFHFSRVFSQHFGMPPHAFQTQLRVSRAKQLLRRGYPIPEIAFLTGFADQSHLARHFKRLVGVPPGQYALSSKNVQDRTTPLN